MILRGEDADDSGDIRDAVSDFLDPSGNWKAIALIDNATYNWADSEALGLWGEWYDTGIVVNDGVGGKTMMHEAMHNLGLVSVWAPNWDGPSNFWELFDANAWTHSRYDEGQWFDRDMPDNNIANCVTGRRYRDALDHQSGGMRQLVILLEGEEPVSVRAEGCGESAFAKSVISYAPLRNNTNSFLEPADYRYMLKNAFDLNRSGERMTQTPESGHTLRFHARINQSGVVTPTISYVEETPGALTPANPSGGYRMTVKDADGLVLSQLPFALSFQQGHIHGPDDDQQLDLEDAQERHFFLRTPWPNDAARMEVWKGSVLIWSQNVSSHAPTVSFVTPNGGNFDPVNGLHVTWTASDGDNDPLLFGLEYSADNGATWTEVAPSLMGSSYHWVPGYLPASATARLRLRASDGILTGSAVSAPFNLSARPPVAFIIDPVTNQQYTEGSLLYLLAGSMTSQGMDGGQFAWSYGGQPIGAGQTLTHTLAETGVHTFTAQVTADGQSDSASVAVHVLADTDMDGMPNEWELAHGLNPLWAGDADEDADGDGLTNGEEYNRGTNPRQADTDGDGVNDGLEVQMGTNPLDPNDRPAGMAELITGVETLRFTAPVNGTAADQRFWITNAASGEIHWSASSNSAWLQLSTLSGHTPEQMTVSVDPSGLAPGVHTGIITVQSPEAVGSPDEVHVVLVVSNPGGFQIFMPTINK